LKTAQRHDSRSRL